MLQLIAQGPQRLQRWRTPLEPGVSSSLGRAASSDLPVPWDAQISRNHLSLTPSADYVDVVRLAESSNSIFYNGEEVEACQVRAGEHFVLGATSFHVLAHDALPSPELPPVEEVTFNRKELRKVRFLDADKRIDVLSRLSEVIDGSRTDSELHQRLSHLILAGVTHADAVAIVELGEHQSLQVSHWERRRDAAGDVRPSGRLITDALSKRKQSVLHVWEPSNEAASDYTAVAEFDWAFCTPVFEGSGGVWGMYVAGRLDFPYTQLGKQGTQGVSLQADVKFTELVAEIISSVRRTNKLERQQSALRQFFAPPILAALGDDLDTDLFEPRECDVTVLFCDLRGFSQQAEESSDDLLGLLERVSRALEVMTQHILQHGGVTGDFQGDAALGFWGWPIDSADAPLQACRAALGIRAAFAETRDRQEHPLANFQMGIGIAYGRAVAGKIGTSEQVKVTVFGPVVNLASRLESMTKQLRVPIVLDEATADIVRGRLDTFDGRLRRLARVQPYGIETPLVVSELLPTAADYAELTDDHLTTYEIGVDHFTAGRWEEAYRCLHEMPSSDRAQDFLGMLIAQHNRVAPADWDGIVRLPGK